MISPRRSQTSPSRSSATNRCSLSLQLITGVHQFDRVVDHAILQRPIQPLDFLLAFLALGDVGRDATERVRLPVLPRRGTRAER